MSKPEDKSPKNNQLLQELSSLFPFSSFFRNRIKVRKIPIFVPIETVPTLENIQENLRKLSRDNPISQADIDAFESIEIPEKFKLDVWIDDKSKASRFIIRDSSGNAVIEQG